MKPLLTARTEEEEEGTSSPEVKSRRQPGGWNTMPYIIGNETFERVATFGLTANFTVFLVGHFNMPTVAAANLSNIWSGTTNIAPLLGAFLSDAYWGKFKTLAVGSIATLLGMTALTLTTVFEDPGKQSCSIEMQQLGRCNGPSWQHLSLLITALIFLTLGAAGIRPCSLPFGMDQFDRTSEKGRRGMNSFFNWYYATNNAATVLALTLVVYIQDNFGWRWGFFVPTILMLFATILFFLGTRLYICVTPEGSVFSNIIQVVVAAYKKRSMKLPSPAEQELTLYNPPLARNGFIDDLPLTQQFSFFNKAAIELDGEVNPKDGLQLNPWELCSIQQVEELKCLIRIVPIWASGIICFVAIAQQWSMAVLQGLKMDRNLGPNVKIPPASLGTVSLVSIFIFLPLYDQFVVPVITRITKRVGGITLLQRMGVGIVISALSMLLAGLVEAKRRALALSDEDGTPMSVMWLVPQLVLVGISEAFNAVGQIEFYNQQFPEQLRSLATSLFSCSLAGASYLSSILVALVQNYSSWNGGPNWLDNDINAGRVDYFYYLLAAIGMANLLYFLVCAHYYHYKGIQQGKDGYHHLI